MDISTLEMLALMASGVAIIVCITLATTSKSRLLKAGGYAFTAALIIAVAAAVFRTPAKDADALHARNIADANVLAAVFPLVLRSSANEGPPRTMLDPDGPLTCRYIRGQVDQSNGEKRLRSHGITLIAVAQAL